MSLQYNFSFTITIYLSYDKFLNKLVICDISLYLSLTKKSAHENY